MSDDWRSKAKCANDETFHKLDRDSLVDAIAVCRGCPVIDACLAWVVAEPKSEHTGYEGVAAGRYWFNGRVKAVPKLQREWTKEALLTAHQNYNRGLRDAETRAGERIYNTGNRRRQRGVAA